MRWSAGLTAASWLLAVGLIGGAAPAPLVLTALVPAFAFTGLSVAHGIAYLVRGPAPAVGCKTCAEKARARQQEARWKRLRWRLSHPFAQRPTARKRKKRACRSCGPRTADTAIRRADELPKADPHLRELVEATPEFQALIPFLEATEPVDSWQYDLRSHFVYELNAGAYGDGATALFVASWGADTPPTAVIVVPDGNGAEPRIVDLRATNMTV
jgi:hypothetical protein